MAHYAYLDENNVVTQIIVGRDEGEVVDGISDWEEYYGAKRCSYNTHAGEHPDGGNKAFRKNYPGIGWIYSEELDGFHPPQPFPSWTLNPQTCLWDAPTPYPGDENNFYAWDEQSLSWVFVTSMGAEQ